MAYTLQAIVGRTVALNAFRGELPVVALAQDLVMIPLAESVRSACGGIPVLPLTDEGNETIPSSLAGLCERLSECGCIAYLEAEFFGGAGTQAMVLAEHGRIIARPTVAPDAINQALRNLGVSIENQHDEFEAVGLGRHRDTDDWVGGGNVTAVQHGVEPDGRCAPAG